jgi:hypothetical protein
MPPFRGQLDRLAKLVGANITPLARASLDFLDVIIAL